MYLAAAPSSRFDRIGRVLFVNSQMLCAALAHQNDFDVCWARGSVSELLFAPLVSHCSLSAQSLPLLLQANHLHALSHC